MSYHNIYEQYGEKFYQLPKVFFTSPIYTKILNDRDKIAYSMLKDRLSLSTQNGWYDDDGNIFFVYSNIALEKILCCSNKTVVLIKKNLTKANLLEVKRNGQGKPDHLYLKKPIVSKEDIYEINKTETLAGVEKCKNYTSEKEPETLGGVEKCKNYTSRNVDFTPLEVKKLHPNNTEYIKTEINKTEYINPNPNLNQETDVNIDSLIEKVRTEKERVEYENKNRQIFGREKDANDLNLPLPIKKYIYHQDLFGYGHGKGQGIHDSLNPLDIEHFYNTNPYIDNTVDKLDSGFINDYEFLLIIKSIVEKGPRPIKNTLGILKNYTLRFMSYKTENAEYTEMVNTHGIPVKNSNSKAGTLYNWLEE